MAQPKPLPGHREVFPRVIQLLEDRRAQGKNKYGLVLQTFNGRDPLWDLWEEMADGMQYLVQRKMQDEVIAEVLLKAMDYAAEHKWTKTVNMVGYALELLDGKPPHKMDVNPKEVSPP